VLGHRRWLLLSLLGCVALALSSCGSGARTAASSSAATPAAKAHAFALATDACREYDTFIEAQQAHEGASDPGVELERFLDHTQVRARKLQAAMSPVESLPGVAKYVAALTAEETSLQALSAQLSKGANAYLKLSQSEPFATSTRRVSAEVGEDAKALGLHSCEGPRPRSAHAG
jgi:hypothetical protein